MRNRPSKAEIQAELARREKAEKGLSGIGEDINESLENLPDAASELVASIPGGVNNVGDYATQNNPLKTGAQLGGGAVEAGAGLASSPQVLARYLSEKFPMMGKAMERGKFQGKGINDPTIFEDLMKLEKAYGLEGNEQEKSVRNLGGLLSGAGLLRKIPSMFGRTGTIAAESGGRGGDPLHAAILGILGEGSAKIPYGKARDLPTALKNMAQAAPDKIKSMAQQMPELSANMGQVIGAPLSAALKDVPKHGHKAAYEGLESLADMAAKMHIPVLPKKLLTKAYQQKYASTTPEQLAKERLFGDIEHEDLPQIEERIAAAKRLGLSYLTPAEAAQSPFESAKQGTVGRTSVGSKLLLKKGKERANSEATAINSLLDEIYDAKKLAPDMKAAYDVTMENSVPPEFEEKWRKNENVKKAIHELETEPEYKQELGQVPKNSFEYWDHVKRVLADIEGGHKKPVGTKKFKMGSVTKTRNQMVDEMDLIEPAYETARGISERNFTRKDIEKFFDKRKMTGNNFYKLISSKEKFNDLMRKLDPFPKAQQKLKDMQLLFEDLIPNNPSLRTAAALEKTSMSSARNKNDAIRRQLDEKYGKKHDVAHVNLMTDPNMLSHLSEFLKNKGTE